MKWFEGIGRGPFNYQREVLRRPRKTTKRITSRKKSVAAAGEQSKYTMGSKAKWETLVLAIFALTLPLTGLPR